MTDFSKLNKKLIYSTWIMMILTIIQFSIMIENHYHSQKNQVLFKELILKDNLLLQANNK